MAYNESPSYVKALDPARFPITPYVVGPVGFAGYQTIQAALTAADGAGGGAVWIMPGTYTENLTLYPSSQIIGAVSNSDAPLAGTVIISGVHTPPSTGFVSFTNVFLSSATDIFNSAAAGTAILVLENCTTNCTSGYTFNVPNWTASGYLVQFNCQQADVDNGCVNNSGGAIIFFETSNVGQGTGKTMVTSGFVHFNEVDLMCPWNCTTGTILDLDTVTFSYTVTFSNNTTGTIRWGSFITGGSPAITMSSSAAVSLLGGIVNSSNNPAIAGAGAGTFTLSNVTFVDNAVIAGTLTTSGVGGMMLGDFGTTGEVMTSNGPGVVPSFQAAPAPSPVILSAVTTLTAAQIRTLFSSPVTLIAAPGANTQINILGYAFLFTYGGTDQFADGSAVNIYIGTPTTADINTSIAASIINGAATLSGSKNANNTDTSASTTNQTIYLAAASADFTGNAANDNTLKVQVLYYLTTLS